MPEYNIEVSFKKCDQIIKLLKKTGVPKDTEDPVPIKLPPEINGNFNLVTVAINHQTTPLVGQALFGESFDGVQRKGWDYLRERWLMSVKELPELVTPGIWVGLSARNLKNILSDGKGGGVITDLEGRARLLRDLGGTFLKNNWKSVSDLYEISGGFLKRENKRGLFDLLAQAEAYNDPLAKKSRYFLALMRNNGGWQYKDLVNLGSPVNYHETRLHLRLGTVEINDSDLKLRLSTKGLVSEKEDLAIRETVFFAIDYIARSLKITPSEAHYLFWNFARNDCPRENPHCDGCPPGCSLPERYRKLSPNRCLFAEVCDKNTTLLEHNFATEWY